MSNKIPQYAAFRPGRTSKDRLKAVYAKGLESDEVQGDHARYRRRKIDD